MIGTLVTLKLRILANRFRRSTWQVVGLVLALLYGGGIGIVAVLLLTGLRYAPTEVAARVVVLGGSGVVLGFLLVPLLVGVDDALDPKRFALLGVDSGRLAVGLLVAGVVGVPGLVLSLVALATVVTWSRTPAAALTALVAAPITVLTCVLLSRISAGASTLLLATRRTRENVSGLAVVLLVLAGPAVLLLSGVTAGPGLAAALTGITAVLAWTPLGATWAAPASVAAGDPAGAGQLAVGFATVAVLALLWRRLIGAMLVTPARAGRPQQVHGLGWFARLPATPLGAVTARSLIYWARDVRYRVSALVIPITPVAVVALLAFAGVPLHVLALLPVPVVALFAGWTGHNDLAYDHTAIWLHVAAGIRGRADRLGRVLPVLVVALLLLIAGSFVSAAVVGDPGVALALIGVSVSLLCAGAGLGAITSALLPYPVPRPGDSPFQQPNASGGLASVVQSAMFVVQLLAAVPAALLGWRGLQGGGDGWYWASLGTGVAVGVLLLWLGTVQGGRLFERRGPELLAAAVRA